MNNLLNSIEIATLFLDRELNIRQFTSPATKIFKLIKSDIGRPYTDQNTDLIYPEMLNDAKEVLRRQPEASQTFLRRTSLFRCRRQGSPD